MIGFLFLLPIVLIWFLIYTIKKCKKKPHKDKIVDIMLIVSIILLLFISIIVVISLIYFINIDWGNNAEYTK